MCDGDDTASVQLCLQLEALLNSRTESVAVKLLESLPPLPVSCRLIAGEDGFRVSLADSVSDPDIRSLELRAVLDALVSIAAELPRQSRIEGLAVIVKKVISKTVRSSVPAYWQNAGLSVLCWLHWQCCIRVPDVMLHHQQLHTLLSFLLQEPAPAVKQMLCRHHLARYSNFAKRLRHFRPSPVDAPAFCWPEREAYAAMSRVSNESRVLVTIHLGDFFGAFKCIADVQGDERSVISLKRDGDTAAITQLSSRVATRHKVFTKARANSMQIVRALRAGGHTLAVLFDLGPDYGETAQVLFFGYKARFVRGPAEIALCGRARIYPFVCFSEAGREHIQMEPAFMPEIEPGETLQVAAARVTQTLVSMAEHWIRQYPSQWKYLDRLPRYLVADDWQHRHDNSSQGAMCHAQ